QRRPATQEALQGRGPSPLRRADRDPQAPWLEPGREIGPRPRVPHRGRREGSRVMLPKLLTIVTAIALLVGCGGHVNKGTLFGPEVRAVTVPRRPQVSIAVPAIADLRPEEEHKGDSVKTR